MSAIVEKFGESYGFIKELNQKNVLEIYKACLIAKEDIGKDPDDEIRTKVFTVELCGKDSPEITFSKKQLSIYDAHIAYLLGQLKVAHDAVEKFTLPMGFINYRGLPWTKDNTTLVALYYLGIANGNLSQFTRIPDSDKVASSLQSVRRSVSPNDPVCEQAVKEVIEELKRKVIGAFLKSEENKELLNKIKEENEKKIRDTLEKARDSVRYWERQTVEDIIRDPDRRRMIYSNWELRRVYEDMYTKELKRRKQVLAELEEKARKVGIE